MSDSHKDPIREQLVKARRAQILAAAASVFAEKGFHRTTTREIAATAGIAEGTIYNYFDSKEDLLVGIMAQLAELEILPEELLEGLQGDVRDFFVAIFQHRMDRIQRGQEMLQAILPEVVSNPTLREHYYQNFVLRIATLIEQYVQARIEMGHIRPVNAALAARAIQGMFVGLLIFRILGDEPLLGDWDEIPETLATMIFDGLSPREEA
jgi:AcrR family transcriptional regulator